MGKMVDKSKKEIDQILREGAMAMFLKDDETNKDIENFTNASIEDILNTRTESVVHKDNVEESLFSQAVFVADTKDAGVNINDADFWDRIGVKKVFEEKQSVTNKRRRRTRINYCEDELYKARVGGVLEGSVIQ
eukprot:UN01574